MASELGTEDFLDDIGNEKGDWIHEDGDGGRDAEDRNDLRAEKVHADQHRHKDTKEKIDFVYLCESEFHRANISGGLMIFFPEESNEANRAY